MPWLLFRRDFDFKPRPQFMICYRAGHRYLVTRACAAEAMLAGAGELCERPVKEGSDDRRR